VKKERPPSQGGPPHQNNSSTLPLGVNGTGCYSSAVTASTLAIEAPSNLQHYSPGTNGHHEPPNPLKDYRLSWLGELGCLPFRGKKTYAILSRLVLRIQHSTDKLICIGKDELAKLAGVSKRTADRAIKELIAFGCLRLVKEGGSTPVGSKRDANWYALGERFNGTPPPARLKNRRALRPVSPVTLVPQAPPVSPVTADQCHALHPLTNKHTNTHKKESPLAFKQENWMAHTENPTLFPGWPREDRERCFLKAKAKGYETDETWRGCCAFYFKQWQRLNAKTQGSIPKAFQNYAKPKAKKYNPLSTDGCNSPPTYRLAGYSSYVDWANAGCIPKGRD
jgi:hypothetical protein